MPGISYGSPTHGSATFQSKALDNYKNIVESMKAESSVNILTEGVSDAIGSELVYEDLKSRLLEGVNEGERDAFAQLFENTRIVMLQESMMSGSNPISALSLPMLRIGWPKIAVREGLPTEPVEQPKFKVTTKRPYVRGEDGTKRFLPEALTGANPFEHTLPKLEETAIAATNGQIVAYDLLAPISKNTLMGDEIDPNFAIVEVSLDFPTAGATTRTVEFQLDTNINVVSGDVTVGTGVNAETATILAKVNRTGGILDVAALGAELTSVKVRGFVTSEANNAATQIGFDITAIECEIGTAQPVESPINIQQMTDLMEGRLESYQ